MIGKLFSGKSGRDAAAWSANYLTNEGINPSLNAVNQAQTDALGSIRMGYGQARDALGSGIAGARQNLTAGRDGAQGFLSQAAGEYRPYLDGVMRGFSAYGDATGANGADGIGRANAQFRQIEGYQGGLNTGLDQLERRAAARGMLGGGNTSADTIRFASDYDAQNFGRYLSALAPFLGAAGSANNTMLGLRGQQAALEDNYGRSMAGLDTSLGNSLASLFAGQGDREAANAWSGANAANQVRATFVPQVTQAGQQGMMAGQQAAANQMGAMLGGANLLSSLAGQMFGSGGLSSMFGGGMSAPTRLPGAV